MKASVFVLSMILSFLGIQSSAQAAEGPHAIQCIYNVPGGVEQTATFVASQSVNLLGLQLNKVLFSVNSSKTPTEFAVERIFTKRGTITKFSFKHPFFVSDIVLTHSNFFDGPVFTGTWATDYPPGYQLDCAFL